MGKKTKKCLLIETAALALLALCATVFDILFHDSVTLIIAGGAVFLAGFIFVKLIFNYFICKNNIPTISATEQYLASVSESVSGGTLRFRLDEGLPIVSVSSIFLNFTGYSRAEIKEKFDDSFLNMIDESYRAAVLDALHNQTVENNKAQIFFSLKCASGGKDVIDVYSPLSHRRGVQNFLIDTAALKHLQSEKDIAAERYRIVAEQSESIIFDYNNIDKTVYLNSYFKAKFGYDVTGNLFDAIERHKLIHEEDLEKFMSIPSTEGEYNEVELRIRKHDGEYIWCKLRLTSLRNEKGKTIRLIGKVLDIDTSRKEKQQLIERTRRDEMTGLYNKQFTEQLISEALGKDADTALSAFLLLDIDNFKNINDTFGHIQGDAVLSQICGDLLLIFRSTDIIGRIGGDEFVVFIKNISSEDHAAKKALDILRLIEEKYSEEKDGFRVSVSVGISFYEKDGTSYKELFMKADKALYKAKKKGKNTYEVYKSA